MASRQAHNAILNLHDLVFVLYILYLSDCLYLHDYVLLQPFTHNALCIPGDRVYFPGISMIGLNGSIIARTTPYSLSEVEIITATVDLESIRCYRSLIRSRCLHASQSQAYPRVQVLWNNYRLSVAD